LAFFFVFFFFFWGGGEVSVLRINGNHGSWCFHLSSENLLLTLFLE